MIQVHVLFHLSVGHVTHFALENIKVFTLNNTHYEDLDRISLMFLVHFIEGTT